MSDLIFIMGRQRSGTTVFRRYLFSLGALDCDEIFHGDLTKPHRFYAYVRDRQRAEPGLIHPETHRWLFPAYIDALRSAADGRPLAIDVKHYALGFVPPIGEIGRARPYIFDFIADQGAALVRIVRRNKLRMVISEEMSIRTDVWRVERPEEFVRDKPTLRLEPDRVAARITELTEQDAAVDRLAATCPRLWRLTYEEMFRPDGRFSASATAAAKGALGRADVHDAPDNLRMNPEPMARLVANFDEIARALATGPHAWMTAED